MDAHFIGVFIAYCFSFWLSFKFITSGNPFVFIIGVLWLLGTLKAIFGSIVNHVVSLFTISFDWVGVMLNNIVSMF